MRCDSHPPRNRVARRPKRRSFAARLGASGVPQAPCVSCRMRDRLLNPTYVAPETRMSIRDDLERQVAQERQKLQEQDLAKQECQRLQSERFAVVRPSIDEIVASVGSAHVR